MPDAAFQESTAPLLRPAQVDDMKREQSRLEKMTSGAPHIVNQIQNKGEMTRQLRRLHEQLETQAPKAYAAGQMDSAINRERQLQEEILVGMPTQAEMRRNPSGATDKHRAWEHRNKKKILEWKNIRLKLHAGGDVEGRLIETDVANFEKFRPVGGAGELNMDNEQIPGKQINFSPSGIVDTVILTADEIAVIDRLYPDLKGKLFMMDAGQRAQAKEIVKVELEKVGGGSGGVVKEPSEIQQLRAQAKELGINAYQKGKEDLKTLIAEKEAQ